jgi:hypothetical protein
VAELEKTGKMPGETESKETTPLENHWSSSMNNNYQQPQPQQ